jgi:hypothetical protein
MIAQVNSAFGQALITQRGVIEATRAATAGAFPERVGGGGGAGVIRRDRTYR